MFQILGAAELALLLLFLAGFKKRATYGLVLALHAVSTLSSYKPSRLIRCALYQARGARF